MTTTQHPHQIHTCPTVAELLHRPQRRRTPGGRALTARPAGRLFVWLELDDYARPTPPFTAGTAELMDPMTEQLAHIYVHRRAASAWYSNWNSTGYLYAPARAADVLLRVVWDIDSGRLDTARVVAPIIAAARDRIDGAGKKAARRAAAVAVVANLEDQLNAAALEFHRIDR